MKHQKEAVRENVFDLIYIWEHGIKHIHYTRENFCFKSCWSSSIHFEHIPEECMVVWILGNRHFKAEFWSLTYKTTQESQNPSLSMKIPFKKINGKIGV